ncbi:unnamed protein product [Arabis nemorensis]|uniref:Rhodanese domain-containing protein n=1 Tax=Arabis nemorensis TaxID=586526 RepID=A0A565C4P7_9BRAS|nr:unnamed protein product [Arabis nemorensis]
MGGGYSAWVDAGFAGDIPPEELKIACKFRPNLMQKEWEKQSAHVKLLSCNKETMMFKREWAIFTSYINLK